MKRLGYPRYEISNFASPGFESRHNLTYWRQGYYLGLGLNAASMLPAAGRGVYPPYEHRVHCATINACYAGNRLPVGETVSVSSGEAMFETVMLGLRTADGVALCGF